MSKEEFDIAIEEASVWLALLHGPRRDEKIAQGFQRWLGESVARQNAFEAVTRMWELTERLPKHPLPLPMRWKRAGFKTGFRWAAGAVGVAAALIAAVGFLYLRQAGVTTAVGEQRMLTFEDGSRVYLNSDTRIRMQYSAERRRMVLERGEALFEVAKDERRRPFVVSAAGREIMALGTAFVVKQDTQSLTVTLMEGRVDVWPSAITAESGGRASLTPGERITFTSDRPPRVDRPNVNKVTAWRRGRVELRNTPLTEAVAEMNRYSAVKLLIERPSATHVPVTGAFRSGDSMSFAQSVADACGLIVIEGDKQILLSGDPAPNCR